jgi:hypothetical protein
MIAAEAEAEQRGEAVSAPHGNRGRRGLRRFGQRGVPVVQAGTDVVRRVAAALALVAHQDRTGGSDAGEAGQSEELPGAHGP